jgi:hypothetical protein
MALMPPHVGGAGDVEPEVGEDGEGIAADTLRSQPPEAFLHLHAEHVRRPASTSRTYGRFAVDPFRARSWTRASIRRAQEQAEQRRKKINNQN